ncbi:MAG: hypothetical protein HC778_08985 [Chamaesiphon sp. CSU_1_12]|nr:hypothetical protein [Chamaesiphon sp. CSU_1_12]
MNFKKVKNVLTKLYWFGFGIGLFLVISGIWLAFGPETAKVRAEPPPVVNILASQTLDTLGKFANSGSVSLPAEVAAIIGTNNISWTAGSKPADTIPIGVWNAAFKVGELSPATINPRIDMSAVSLGEFKYVKVMSIETLTKRHSRTQKYLNC